MLQAKKLTKAIYCMSLCAFGLTVGAAAAVADGIPGSIKDAPMQRSWQGFYVGTHASLVTGDTQGDVVGILTDYDVSGSLAGFQLGYNWQRGSSVFGIEGSYSFGNVQGNTACLVVFDCKRDFDALGTVTARYGMVFGNTLYYGLAGAAFADVDTTVSIVGIPILTGSDNRVGWVAGFGLEHVLSDRLTARIEYSHIDFGTDTTTLTGGIPDRVDLKLDTIRLGVNLKLSN
jgi:opacity protein-like surface antigen